MESIIWELQGSWLSLFLSWSTDQGMRAPEAVVVIVLRTEEYVLHLHIPK